MDIGKIHGSNHVGGTNQSRADKVARDGAEKTRSSLGSPDVAQISDSGREALDRVEELAQRARQGDGDRSDIVAAAKARLESGALDTPEVYEAVARRLG